MVFLNLEIKIRSKLQLLKAIKLKLTFIGTKYYKEEHNRKQQ